MQSNSTQIDIIKIMEITFNSCSRLLIAAFVVIAFLLCLIFLSSKESVQIASSIFLVIFIVIAFRIKNTVAKIVLTPNDMEIINCGRFGLPGKNIKNKYSNISFSFSKEIYKQGIHNVLRIYESDSGKLIGKLEDSVDKEKIEKVLSVLIQNECKKKKPKPNLYYNADLENR